MSNDIRFKQSMAALAAVYQNNITPEMIKVYWQHLGSQNPDHLEMAINSHIDNPNDGKYFPKPAHLISYINEIKAKIKRDEYFNDQKERKRIKHVKTQEQIETGMAAIKKMKEQL